MHNDLETRRRRAAYRAQHRGTKELDFLIGRYADAHLDEFPDDKLARFEAFLAISEPLIQSWIFGEEPAEHTEFSELVADIRKFHGLEPQR